MKDGSGFIAQKTDGSDFIDTSFIKLKLGVDNNGLPYQTVISKLPTDIREMVVSPDSKKIFYLISSSGSQGFVSNPDGTNKSLIFSNFLSEWIPEWVNPNNILIKSKASSKKESIGLLLNPNTKSVTQSYADLYGASSLGRSDNKFTLLSVSGGTPNLELLNNSDKSIINVKTSTITEKCVWNPADLKFVYCAVPKHATENMPDSWYKGEVETNDTIQKINVFDLYTYVISNLEPDSKEKIDVENMQTSKDGKYLVFQNKVDESLWLLEN